MPRCSKRLCSQQCPLADLWVRPAIRGSGANTWLCKQIKPVKLSSDEATPSVVDVDGYSAKKEPQEEVKATFASLATFEHVSSLKWNKSQHQEPIEKVVRKAPEIVRKEPRLFSIRQEADRSQHTEKQRFHSKRIRYFLVRYRYTKHASIELKVANLQPISCERGLEERSAPWPHRSEEGLWSKLLKHAFPSPREISRGHDFKDSSWAGFRSHSLHLRLKKHFCNTGPPRPRPSNQKIIKQNISKKGYSLHRINKEFLINNHDQLWERSKLEQSRIQAW